MRILGLVFAGTSTERRPAMARFLRETLGLAPAAVDGVEAELFRLPDGSTFAVASPGGTGDTDRSVGFLVDDLAGALAELRSAGVPVGPVSENAQERYAHFRAPDGQLYEPVERRPSR
ncbi:VOC family protein [Streptomyces sp. NRRL B-24484]|uniref:VOC family protein n=1 Tax=Streptomyces sp. NRRL B-24484 TaxID=1463833 RepID=UPI0004C20E87|nr:glyoxalase/bleomycin resistance/dioxygenase family protein [Streptomyces sp. NRRL B-24484]